MLALGLHEVAVVFSEFLNEAVIGHVVVGTMDFDIFHESASIVAELLEDAILLTIEL